MRSLMSPQRRVTSTPPSAHCIPSSPLPSAPATLPVTLPAASPAHTTLTGPTSSTPVTSASFATPATTPSVEPPPLLASQSDLEDENNKLKCQIANLQNMYKCVLDHSVESDTRLLEFTDQVFVANISKTGPSLCDKADQAVQCEAPMGGCQDPRCEETLNLVLRLRNTIEVLEADNSLLRAEAKNCDCHRGPDSGSWTLCLNKKDNAQIKTKNRYELLSTLPENKDTGENISNNISTGTKKKKRKFRKKSTISTNFPVEHTKSKDHRHQKKHSLMSLDFHTVTIEGDSHSRHLAGLVQQRVAAPTRVSGICKPAAKLLDVTSGASPPKGGCCVILAGTNDVAAGQSMNILKYLEQRIIARLSSAKVIVSTIPHRHELHADHPVNQEIVVLNHYIQELCDRHVGAQALNFNSIDRRWFTRHGMHLRLPGKRILAELITRGAVMLDQSASPDAAPPSTTGSRPSASFL